MSAKITFVPVGDGDDVPIISSAAGVRRLPHETSGSPAGGDARQPARLSA